METRRKGKKKKWGKVDMGSGEKGGKGKGKWGKVDMGSGEKGKKGKRGKGGKC